MKNTTNTQTQPTNTISRFTYVKNNGVYELTHTEYKAEDVYQRLSTDLIAKKINKCTYITRITRSNLYNGFVRIYVYYNNGVYACYTIAES